MLSFRYVEELLHELFGGFDISLALDKEVQNFDFIIDGAPEPIALPPDDIRHLIEIPMIAGSRSSAPQICGDEGSNIQEPALDRLLGDVQTPVPVKNLIRIVGFDRGAERATIG